MHAGERQAVVRVETSVIARGERLTLGDISEVRAGDWALAERLRSVALGYAPNVGAVRELARERVLLAIAAAGFSTSEVVVEAPPVIFIRRAGQAVEATLLREAVERAAFLKLSSAGDTVRLVRLDLPANIEVPTGTVETRATLGGVRDLFAPFVVAIEILVDGRVVRRLSATAAVEAHAPVAVAAHDLAAGARIREEDVRIEVQRLSRPVGSYVREASKLRGMSVARPVARGEAVTRDVLEAVIVVRPGDAVRVTGESGKFSIAVAGEARGAGRVGDRIQVKNTQSGTLIQAIVVDEGLVSVRF